MSDSTDTKSSTTSASTAVVNKNKTLTVVVVNEKGQPAQGANVSIAPSNESGVTNNSGEVQFVLGSATKYEVTATAGGKTVTVPYYVTKNGATRLVVNPVYVKSIEAELNSSFFNSSIISNVGIILGIIVISIVVWKLFRRRK